MPPELDGKWEQSVLTLGFLCLLCCVHDSARSWFDALVLSFLRFGNKTKCGVEFLYSILNASKIARKMGKIVS